MVSWKKLILIVYTHQIQPIALKCHIIAIPDCNLAGLFSTEHSKRDIEN